MTEKYIPLNPVVKDRKQRFAELNEFVRSRGGWITSIPGDIDVTVEVLPNSTLPEMLVAAGHDLRPADPPEGQRIVPNAITGYFRSEDNTVETRTMHAGILRVERFTFELP